MRRREVFGMELIVNLYDCSTAKFNKLGIATFVANLCKKMGFKRIKGCWWDDEDSPTKGRDLPKKIRGISFVEFIIGSSIVVHAMKEIKSVYINIFSCNMFDGEKALKICKGFFKAKKWRNWVIVRI